MKKINKYLYFRAGKEPEGLIAEVKYRVKRITDDYYIIAGDIKISKDREDIDYIVEDIQREGGYRD